MIYTKTKNAQVIIFLMFFSFVFFYFFFSLLLHWIYSIIKQCVTAEIDFHSDFLCLLSRIRTPVVFILRTTVPSKHPRTKRNRKKEKYTNGRL